MVSGAPSASPPPSSTPRNAPAAHHAQRATTMTPTSSTPRSLHRRPARPTHPPIRSPAFERRLRRRNPRSVGGQGGAAPKALRRPSEGEQRSPPYLERRLRRRNPVLGGGREDPSREARRRPPEGGRSPPPGHLPHD